MNNYVQSQKIYHRYVFWHNKIDNPIYYLTNRSPLFRFLKVILEYLNGTITGRNIQ